MNATSPPLSTGEKIKEGAKDAFNKTAEFTKDAANKTAEFVEGAIQDIANFFKSDSADIRSPLVILLVAAGATAAFLLSATH